MKHESDDEVVAGPRAPRSDTYMSDCKVFESLSLCTQCKELSSSSSRGGNEPGATCLTSHVAASRSSRLSTCGREQILVAAASLEAAGAQARAQVAGTQAVGLQGAAPAGVRAAAGVAASSSGRRARGSERCATSRVLGRGKPVSLRSTGRDSSGSTAGDDVADAVARERGSIDGDAWQRLAPRSSRSILSKPPSPLGVTRHVAIPRLLTASLLSCRSSSHRPRQGSSRPLSRSPSLWSPRPHKSHTAFHDSHPSPSLGSYTLSDESSERASSAQNASADNRAVAASPCVGVCDLKGVRGDPRGDHSPAASEPDSRDCASPRRPDATELDPPRLGSWFTMGEPRGLGIDSPLDSPRGFLSAKSEADSFGGDSNEPGSPSEYLSARSDEGSHNGASPTLPTRDASPLGRFCNGTRMPSVPPLTVPLSFCTRADLQRCTAAAPRAS